MILKIGKSAGAEGPTTTTATRRGAAAVMPFPSNLVPASSAPDSRGGCIGRGTDGGGDGSGTAEGGVVGGSGVDVDVDVDASPWDLQLLAARGALPECEDVLRAGGARGECFANALEACAANPDWRIVAGSAGGIVDHWFCQRGDGRFVDPTLRDDRFALSGVALPRTVLPLLEREALGEVRHGPAALIRATGPETLHGALLLAHFEAALRTSGVEHCSRLPAVSVFVAGRAPLVLAEGSATEVADFVRAMFCEHARKAVFDVHCTDAANSEEREHATKLCRDSLWDDLVRADDRLFVVVARGGDSGVDLAREWSTLQAREGVIDADKRDG